MQLGVQPGEPTSSTASDPTSLRPDLPWLWWLGPLGAVLALGYAYYFYRQVMQQSEGTERMIEIAERAISNATKK